MAIRVRDLGDGACVAGAEFEFTAIGMEKTLRVLTGPDGSLALPEGRFDATLSHPAYHVATAVEQARPACEIWVYRDFAVAGLVTTDPGGAVADLSQVSLEYSLPLDSSGPTPRIGGVLPWTAAWAAESRIRTRGDLGSAGRDGTFDFMVPRIRSLLVIARLQGWRPAWASIDTSQARAAPVHLMLRRSNVLRGRLLAADGSPLAGVNVSCHCGIVVPFDRVDMATLALTGHSVTLVGNSGYNTARVTFIASAQTEADGSFEVLLNADGDVRLMAWPVNMSPATLSPGRVAEDRSGLTLVSGKASGKRVRFLAGGKPLAGMQIVYGDLSSPVGQPTPGAVVLADDGSMSADWLEEGHRYAVIVLGPIADRLSNEKKDVLVWAGQSSVDVTTDLEALE